ncbi:coenzyme F420-reducing hydrogenase beta subunit [Anaerobacterium chartisolvens]|uniref:Coenzyme F420-reducing hydrogenase beta subunit n=1 Tax=Anaerobacterium chartisolvens TaxID=1297424 RepID=A0A369BCZ6_9FIRM|nr:Coenzyme F420 hydrogenase/dehydrogenase, beta subunit C-terminal domain [Anaerobacterium chartisolvens]RCX19271.1 coenzyme F420-reducing hydrogenase beta subunit [Anaerobacterium chartisolvens]
MNICGEKECTGCMACYSVCNHGAIAAGADSRGFYMPVIDNDICINCGNCKKVCPANRNVEKSHFKQEVFACWSNDPELRLGSTSGGIFTGLSKYVLSKGGTVFGAKFDSRFRVVHGSAEDERQLACFRGSKYVQSYMGDTYRDIKKRLDRGILVLFTGTPCQNAGLKCFLGKPYNNLIAVDIICHGVPSPLVFNDYVEYMKKKANSDISSISFRHKQPGWTVHSMKIDFSNNSSYMADVLTDPYLVGFLQNYFLRDCCHECKYAVLDRQGDITIADFWGYVSNRRKFRNDEKGISLVIINSKTGRDILEAVKGDYVVQKKDMREALNGNRCLQAPYGKNPLSDLFWKEYLDCRDFGLASQKYFYKRKSSLRRMVSRFIDDHSYLMPVDIRKKYENIKDRLKQKFYKKEQK